MFKLDLKTAKLSVLRAMAISISKEIDAGDLSNADLLEEVFVFIQTARV